MFTTAIYQGFYPLPYPSRNHSRSWWSRRRWTTPLRKTWVAQARPRTWSRTWGASAAEFSKDFTSHKLWFWHILAMVYWGYVYMAQLKDMQGFMWKAANLVASFLSHGPVECLMALPRTSRTRRCGPSSCFLQECPYLKLYWSYGPDHQSEGKGSWKIFHSAAQPLWLWLLWQIAGAGEWFWTVHVKDYPFGEL